MGNIKIILITGSYPPNYCGVGDYTAKLFECFKHTGGVTVALFNRQDWKIKNYFKYLRDLLKLHGNIYHFQYPTEGYGYSLVPLMLIGSLLGKKKIVTVHELSSRNKLAYIYTQILIFLSNKTIVANKLEYKHASRFVFDSKKIHVIPIGSNIQKSNLANSLFEDRKIDLAYFGHIRPIKGIESFLHTASLLKCNWNIKIIGQVLNKYIDFYEQIRFDAENLNVELVANKDENEVSDILASVKIVYLPFPDGVSNRRGTLLAAIQNGCTVVSTKSDNNEFNDFFDKYCYLVDSDEDAASIINELLNGEKMPKDHKDLKKWFSWDNIVSTHVEIYNSLANIEKR